MMAIILHFDQLAPMLRAIASFLAPMSEAHREANKALGRKTRRRTVTPRLPFLHSKLVSGQGVRISYTFSHARFDSKNGAQ